MGSSGVVTLEGRPLRGAEVLRVDGPSPTAITRTDAGGRYTLDDSPGDRIVLRVTDPVVGVWVHDGADPDFAIARSELVDIHVEVRSPDGETFEWLDVKLTPRRDEVPPRVNLATGVAPGLAEAMYAVRIVEPRVHVTVRPGRYDLCAYRLVDGPKGAVHGNVVADRVTVAGAPVAPKLGGFEVELGGACAIIVALRPATREDL